MLVVHIRAGEPSGRILLIQDLLQIPLWQSHGIANLRTGDDLRLSALFFYGKFVIAGIKIRNALCGLVHRHIADAKAVHRGS